MSDPVARPPVDQSTQLAAERTLLAWVRTGLSMMGIGFVVARFGLYMTEIRTAEQLPPRARTGFSLWIGVTLVLMGVVVNVFSLMEHSKLIEHLERGGGDRPAHRLTLRFTVPAVLALFGVVMAVYLVMVR